MVVGKMKHENAQLACQRTCNSQHRDDVAFTATCYVLLGAIDSQLIAITTGGGFQRRCTGTGVWFGQTEATQHPIGRRTPVSRATASAVSRREVQIAATSTPRTALHAS